MAGSIQLINTAALAIHIHTSPRHLEEAGDGSTCENSSGFQLGVRVPKNFPAPKERLNLLAHPFGRPFGT